MSRIDIPFNGKFREVMLNGTKTMTSRNKKYGDPGDTFERFEAVFVIKRIQQKNLGDIAANFFIEEGCESPADFMDIWKKLHPRRGWDPDQMVWTHEFQKEAEQKKLEV